MKRKKQLSYLYFVGSIFLLIGTLAWMVTIASQGEILNYNRRLIVPTINMNIQLYKLENEVYREVTESVIDLGNIAPGDKIDFKFVIQNNEEQLGTAKILFSSITGDIVDLEEKIIFHALGPSPHIFTKPLKEGLKVIGDNQSMFEFINYLEVQGLTTMELLWRVEVPNTASNEIAGKGIVINSISVIKP